MPLTAALHSLTERLRAAAGDSALTSACHVTLPESLFLLAKRDPGGLTSPDPPHCREDTWASSVNTLPAKASSGALGGAVIRAVVTAASFPGRPQASQNGYKAMPSPVWPQPRPGAQPSQEG